MKTVLGNRVDNIDQQLKNHSDRIDNMEVLLGSKVLHYVPAHQSQPFRGETSCECN